MVINIKHNGKIKIEKKPSKKRMKLTGKTVFDKYSSNYNKTVWEKQIIKVDGVRQVKYVLSYCDNKICNGHIIYDKRGYKVCCICGLSKKYDNNIFEKISINESSFGSNYINIYETIKNRNIMWDTKNIDKFIFEKDKGASQLIDRYNRIKEFENNIKRQENDKR